MRESKKKETAWHNFTEKISKFRSKIKIQAQWLPNQLHPILREDEEKGT